MMDHFPLTLLVNRVRIVSDLVSFFMVSTVRPISDGGGGKEKSLLS